MSEFAIVNTEYGKVRGVTKTSQLDTKFHAFLGIPYATPPVGELRFKDPQPPSNWDDVVDATFEKSCCFAHNFYKKKIVGSDDCLFLNIFSKNIEPDARQPVFIFCHGGGFNSGSSTTDILGPDYMLMADVVLVTINYRLGAFGFLCMKDKELNVPGNAGLKDQLMAMKFVKNNIQNFGGDPNNITLFGHSAGGSSVSWHCVSERSKGLFNRAIIMSGCVLNRFSITPNRDWAYRLALKLGYDESENEEKILSFLQQADPVEIVKFQDTLLTPEDRGKVSYAFAPQIEHYTTEETFISDYSLELVQKAWSNDIDIMIGGTSDEGLMYLEYLHAAPMLLKTFKLESMIPVELNLAKDDPIIETIVRKLRETYYPEGTEPTEDAMAFCRMKEDQAIRHGIQRIIQARQHSERRGKTFFYRFAVDSPTQNHYRIARLGPEIRGVCHGDEIAYLFKNIYVDVPSRESMEFTAITQIVSLFTSFATTGSPTCHNAINSDLENVVHWHPVATLEPPFMGLNIQPNLKFEAFPESERLTIWDEMYKQTSTPLY